MLIDECLVPAMSITVDSELATIEEATAILLEKMPASKSKEFVEKGAEVYAKV